jgi:hypothetical protein
MSVLLRSVLRSVGVELLGTGLDKVMRIALRAHGPEGDDYGDPSPTETKPEVAPASVSFSQNPTRIFFSEFEVEQLWLSSPELNWNSWYKLALYYLDSQSVERVYIPDAFISLSDNIGSYKPGNIIEIKLVTSDGQPTVGPDGATGSVVNTGFLEAWGDQYIELVADGTFGWATQIDVSTRGEPFNTILTGIPFTVVNDYTVRISLADLMAALAEYNLSSPPIPISDLGHFVFTMWNKVDFTLSPAVGVGSVYKGGSAAPIIRELGVVGLGAATTGSFWAKREDAGYLEGINLDTVTQLDLFSPAVAEITNIPFTVETPQDGFPTRLGFSFEDVYQTNPALWGTMWGQSGQSLWARVTNPAGSYDTYEVVQEGWGSWG